MIRDSRRIAVIAAAALAFAAPRVFADPAPAANAAVKTPVELPAPPAGKGQVVFYRKPMVSLVPFNWIASRGQDRDLQNGGF